LCKVVFNIGKFRLTQEPFGTKAGVDLFTSASIAILLPNDYPSSLGSFNDGQ
jgi:hypothetical protein